MHPFTHSGGITFLLLPPVLYRLYQYRQFKPMVQEVIELRKVIRARAGEDVDGAKEHLEHDLIGDFELQDEALQYVAIVIVVYDLGFLILGSIVLYGAIMSYVRCGALACGLPLPTPLTRARDARRARCRPLLRPARTTSGLQRSRL